LDLQSEKSYTEESTVMVAEVEELCHIITGVGASDSTAGFEHDSSGTSDVKQRLELGILSGNSS
jgi:hypothetical protein